MTAVLEMIELFDIFILVVLRHACVKPLGSVCPKGVRSAAGDLRNGFQKQPTVISYG